MKGRRAPGCSLRDLRVVSAVRKSITSIQREKNAGTKPKKHPEGKRARTDGLGCVTPRRPPADKAPVYRDGRYPGTSYGRLRTSPENTGCAGSPQCRRTLRLVRADE